MGEAIAIYEPLLADHERILGAEHPSTLTTRHNLAFAYQAAGPGACQNPRLRRGSAELPVWLPVTVRTTRAF